MLRELQTVRKITTSIRYGFRWKVKFGDTCSTPVAGKYFKTHKSTSPSSAAAPEFPDSELFSAQFRKENGIVKIFIF